MSMRLDSSYIKSISFNTASHTMTVHFRDGFAAKYFLVHPRTYQAILDADSHGEKFNELMVGKKFVVIKKAA